MCPNLRAVAFGLLFRFLLLVLGLRRSIALGLLTCQVLCFFHKVGLGLAFGLLLRPALNLPTAHGLVPDVMIHIAIAPHRASHALIM